MSYESNTILTEHESNKLLIEIFYTLLVKTDEDFGNIGEYYINNLFTNSITKFIDALYNIDISEFSYQRKSHRITLNYIEATKVFMVWNNKIDDKTKVYLTYLNSVSQNEAQHFTRHLREHMVSKNEEARVEMIRKSAFSGSYIINYFIIPKEYKHLKEVL